MSTVLRAGGGLDAKLTEIGQLGGKVVVAATAIDDKMSFALFADPEGTVVGLLRTTAPFGGRPRPETRRSYASLAGSTRASVPG